MNRCRFIFTAVIVALRISILMMKMSLYSEFTSSAKMGHHHQLTDDQISGRIPSNNSFTSEMFGERWVRWYDGIRAFHFVPEVEISASGCDYSNFQTYELHNTCHEFGWPLFIIITG